MNESFLIFHQGNNFLKANTFRIQFFPSKRHKRKQNDGNSFALKIILTVTFSWIILSMRQKMFVFKVLGLPTVFIVKLESERKK